MTGLHTRAGVATTAVLIGTVLIGTVLTGCSAPSPGEPASAPPAADAPASEAPAEEEPAGSAGEVDLCAAVPQEEITPVLDAYGFTGATATAGTESGSPTCTLTSAAGGEVELRLTGTPFAETIDGQLGPADAPPENDSVYLPLQQAFAAAYGEDTLLVAEDGATSPTPTVLFLAGTALANLP